MCARVYVFGRWNMAATASAVGLLGHPHQQKAAATKTFAGSNSSYAKAATAPPTSPPNGTGAGRFANAMQTSQLSRSLERILEDAHVSGELKLSGRKLRDFPKAAGKYNLNDTTIAGEFE